MRQSPRGVALTLPIILHPQVLSFYSNCNPDSGADSSALLFQFQFYHFQLYMQSKHAIIVYWIFCFPFCVQNKKMFLCLFIWFVWDHMYRGACLQTLEDTLEISSFYHVRIPEVTRLESKHFWLLGRLADLSVTFVYMLRIFVVLSTHSSVAGLMGLLVVFDSQRIRLWVFLCLLIQYPGSHECSPGEELLCKHCRHGLLF